MITNQVQLFFVFIINGIIIGILFDIFRILRRSFKTSNIVTYIEDILFWILTGLILLYSIFTFSDGEIRLYMFIGIFFGSFIYMISISNYFVKINVKIITFIKNIVGKVLILIITPVKFILKRLLFKPIHFITINIGKVPFKSKKLQKNKKFKYF